MYSAFLVISIYVLLSWSEISSVSGSGQRASNRVHSIQDRIRHDPGPIRRIPTVPCSLYSNHPLCRRRRPIRRPPVCRSGSGRDCIPRHSNFPKLPFTDPPMLLPDTIVRRSKRSDDRNGQSSLGERRVVDYRKRISSCGRVGRSYSKFCNRCVCTPNGEICTMRHCLVDFRRAKELSSTPVDRRSKRSVDSSVNNGRSLRQRLGLFDRTIAFPTCGIIGRSYKSECNTCICTTRGPMCTMMACLPPRDFLLRKNDFRRDTPAQETLERIRNQILGQTNDDVTEHEVDDVTESENDVTTEETPVLNVNTEDNQAADSSGSRRLKRSAGLETEDFVARLLARWRCESGSVKQKCCSRCTCSSTGYWQCDYRGRCDPDLCNYDQIVEEDERIRNQLMGQTDGDVTEHEVDDVTESENDVTTEDTPVLDVNTEDNQAADRSESHRFKRSVRPAQDNRRLTMARDIFGRQCVPGARKQAPDCCNSCVCTAQGYWRCGTQMLCVNPGCGHRRNPTISRQRRAAGANPPDNYTRGRWPSFLTGRRVPQTAKQVCVTNANVGKSFYDGCNTCRCSGIAQAACTRKRCFRSLIRQ